MVYYSERLHVEGAILAGYMVDAGEIGKVISVTGFGPHRLGAGNRPAWFFEKEKYGGILCDIGSHQIEQYLHFAGEEDAEVTLARIGNYGHPEYPELDDFGDCAMTGKNGTTNYFRVDWFTPGRPAHLGRRPHPDSGHQRLYRNPQVHQSGCGKRGRQPCIPGQRQG